MKKMTTVARKVDTAGSALVGAIALSVLMAIAGIGFLQVATSGLNNDTVALQDLKALCAAESGVNLGLRWLRGYAGFPTTASGSVLKPFGDSPIFDTVNNLYVYVTIPVQVISGIAVASIKAEVFNHPSVKDASTFKKRITIGNTRISIFGIYCTFYDGYQGTNEIKTILDWHGWDGRTFNGRFHMNNMYNEINAPGEPGVGASPVVFKGLVTSAKPTDANVLSLYYNNYSRDYGGLGHFGNNYNAGVWVQDPTTPWTSVTIPKLDQVFQDRYIADVDPIKLNINNTDGNSLKINIPVSDQIELPASGVPAGFSEGDWYSHYRPTLHFKGGSAYYEYYRTATATYDSVAYGAAVGGSIDGKVFISHNNLNVYTGTGPSGGATGRFTIATDAGKSIVPVGNIVTSDYDPATVTITDPNSQNMIGLISGKTINFNNTWMKRFKAGAGNPTSNNVYDQVTGGLDGTLHISAAIIAVKTVTITNETQQDGSTKSYTMKGCERWQGMWNYDNCTTVRYKYQLYGSHTFNAYMNSIGYSGATWVAGCKKGGLMFDHDPRMYKKLMQPPGFPGVSTTNGLFMLTIGSWTEQNTYY